MAAFPLCPACDKEYRDPLDRRFHAQPVACPECGPHLEWVSHGEHAEQEAALQAAIAQLKMGNIVAIKGIGGFHLACDARNSNAVATLRARKHRPAKPLAVMLPVADGLPDAARQLLTTPAAPIVLVDKKYVPELCDDIAPDLNEVGVMLPANPLQHLLLQELQCPLVMTSGNLSGKPPAISNEQALEDLQGIADGFSYITATSCSGWMIRWCAKAAKCCAVHAGMCRMRWFCLRALKMFRLCCVLARI